MTYLSVCMTSPTPWIFFRKSSDTLFSIKDLSNNGRPPFSLKNINAKACSPVLFMALSRKIVKLLMARCSGTHLTVFSPGKEWDQVLVFGSNRKPSKVLKNASFFRVGWMTKVRPKPDFDIGNRNHFFFFNFSHVLPLLEGIQVLKSLPLNKDLQK